MTRRDVDLVIRAQDRASKTVQSIADALETLSQSQEDAGQAAQGAARLTDRLGASIQKLQAQATALRALDKLSKDLATAGAALKAIEAEAGAAAAAQKRYADQSAAAAADVGRLEESLAKLEAKLARQAAAAEGASAAQKRAADAAAAAQKQYDSLNSRLQRAKNVTDDQRKALANLQSLVASTAAAERRAASQAAPLVKARERTADALAKQQRALRDAQAAVRKLAPAEAAAANSAADTARALERSRSAYADLEDQTGQVRAALEKSGASLQDLGGEALEATRGVETLTRALKAQQAAEESRARAQIAATPGGLRGQYLETLRNLRDTRAAVEQAAEPTAELAQRLLDAEAAADRAGAAYRKFGDAAQDAARKQALQQSKQAEANRLVQLEAVATRQTALANQQAAAAAAALSARQNQAAAATARQKAEVDQLVRSLFRGVESAEALNLSLRRVGDGSRTTLDFTQRLRGQILGLTAAFVGFYNALDQIGRVIAAQRQIDAAFSRLNVAFDTGDQATTEARTAREIRFLREEAGRLAVEFGTLSQEYSKFVVAADAAGFANESIRRIFVATAEAGKVNRASTEELGRVFLALTQIINKQKLTAEELNQQLGEVLPGAASLFAEAMGFGAQNVAQLFAAMENGLIITEADMLRFADALTARFGGALPAALETTTSEIDRLNALIFEARLLVADSGFFDGLRVAVERLNGALSSPEGQDALRNLGALLGELIEIVAALVSNFETLLGTLVAFTAVKASRGILNLAANLRRPGPGALEAARAVFALRDAFAVMETSSTAAGRAVGRVGTTFVSFQRLTFGLVRGLRALLASLGGIPGILGALAIGSAINFFVDLATSSADARNRIDETSASVNKFRDAMAEAKTEAEGLAAARERLIAADVRLELQQVRGDQRDLIIDRPQIRRRESADFEFARNARQQVLDMREALLEGSVSAEEFAARLREIAESGAFDDETSSALVEYARRIQQAEQRVLELEAVLAEIEGTSTEAQQALARLGTTASEVARGATKDFEAFNSALDKIATRIPELQRQRELANQLLEIDQAEREALANAPNAAEAAFIRQAAAEARFRVANEEALELEAEFAEKAADYAENIATANREREEEIRLLAIVDEREEAIARARVERQREAAEAGLVATQDQLDEAADLAARLFDAEQARSAARRPAQGGRDEGAEFLRDLREQNAERRFEIDLLSRSAREQQILRAQRDASNAAARAGLQITREQLAEIARLEGALFDRNNAEAEVNQLFERRRLLQEQIQFARDGGDVAAEQRLAEQLDAVNGQLQEAIQSAIAFYQAMGGAEAENAILRLQNLQAEIAAAGQTAGVTRQDIEKAFSGSLSSSVSRFAQNIANGENAIRSLGDAFRQFAADFLKRVGEMIVEAAALQLAMRVIGFVGGGLFGGGAGAPPIPGGLVGPGMLFHSGGIVGQPAPTRLVSPAWFANAQRYHSGGMPGLKRDEVPAILQTGEEVLSRSDPRNAMNGGAAGSNVRIVNAFDAPSFLEQGLNSRPGERVILNFLRANSGAVKSAIGVS